MNAQPSDLFQAFKEDHMRPTYRTAFVNEAWIAARVRSPSIKAMALKGAQTSLEREGF